MHWGLIRLHRYRLPGIHVDDIKPDMEGENRTLRRDSVNNAGKTIHKIKLNRNRMIETRRDVRKRLILNREGGTGYSDCRLGPSPLGVVEY